MRPIARFKTHCAVALLAIAAGVAAAESRPSPRGRPATPERTGPPIVVAAPDVRQAPGPIMAEVGMAPTRASLSRPVPGSVYVFVPAAPDRESHWQPASLRECTVGSREPLPSPLVSRQ